MRVEQFTSHMEVFLTPKETLGLLGGRSVGDRLLGEAKVEVWPLSAIEEDPTTGDKWAQDRLTKGLTVPVRGIVFSNGDVQVILPNVVLQDVRVTDRLVPREKFEAPLSPNPEELIRQTIPPGGVRVFFGGSLKIIDIPREFERLHESEE